MKKYFIATLAFVAALTLASCIKESAPDTTEDKTIDPQELITISARIPSGAITKVDMEDEDQDEFGGLTLTWHAGDQITVMNAADKSKKQVYTLDAESAGKTEGKFTGKAITADKYIIEYNSIGDDFYYAAQVQNTDGSTDHLKYAATLTNVTDYTDFEFSEDWASAHSATFESSSVLRVRAKIEDVDPDDEKAFGPANIYAVTLKFDAPVFSFGNEIKVIIDKPADEGEEDFVTVFATLPVGDFAIEAGTSLIAQFQLSGNEYDKYTVYRPNLGGGTIAGGQLNCFNIDCGENMDKFANKSDENIGTEENPYLVGDQHQMAAMYDEMEDGDFIYFVLIDDIDMTGIEWKSLNHVEGDSVDYIFNKGIDFDGQNHIISNLNVGSEAGYPSFAGVAYGDYKDVTFENATIDGGSNNVGVFAGYIGTNGNKNEISYQRWANVSGITIKNSTVICTAGKNTRNAGGFAGVVNQKDCVISDCHVEGTTVTQNQTGAYTGCNVGGFIGKLSAAESVTGCTAQATLHNENSYYTGGFIGQTDGAVEVTDCAFLGGKLTATRANINSPVAGFIGYIPNNKVATIKNCHVTDAEIDAPNCGRSGGFVGQVGDGGSEIESCYVEKTSVSGGLNTGGFAGVFYQSSIKKSYVTETTIIANTDKVIKEQGHGGAAAGFVAFPQKSTIEDCYVTSSVNVVGGDYEFVGGFYGVLLDKTTTTECYEAANVTGTKTTVGAFIGGIDALPTSLTKCIAWDNSLNFWGASDLDPAKIAEKVYDNYCGKDGTVSSQAQALEWDTDVWDYTAGPWPVLK